MTGSTGRGDWRTRCESESLMSSDATTFVLSNTLRAWEGEALVFERTWESRIPRDLV